MHSFGRSGALATLHRPALPIGFCALLFSFELLAFPTPVLADSGPPPAQVDLLKSWSWDPTLLLLFALSGWLYLRGARRLWRRAGRGHGLHLWQARLFYAGFGVLVLALVSPLDALGAALFSAHMAQHLLLMLVAAPLIALGDPGLVLLWALPPGWRRPVARVVRRGVVGQLWKQIRKPGAAWLLAAVALWLWHVPGLFELALRLPAVHSLEHLCLFGSSLLYWHVALRRSGHTGFSYLAGIVYIFSMALVGSVLGIILTFMSSPWYGIYAGSTAAFGLTPMEDQQAAGLLMWIPAGLVYLVTALALFACWLEADERRERSGSPSEPEPRLEAVQRGAHG